MFSFEFNETIEEDESVRRIRNAHHQTSLGTLDECFQDYTQEERVDCVTCLNVQILASKQNLSLNFVQLLDSSLRFDWCEGCVDSCFDKLPSNIWDFLHNAKNNNMS